MRKHNANTKGGWIDHETALRYGMKPEDEKLHNILASQGRLALSVEEAGIDEVVARPENGAAIGDVIVPTAGAFKGVPLRVQGFGGPKMEIDPTGLPYGETSYWVVTTFYKDRLNTGVRILLPNEEWK